MSGRPGHHPQLKDSHRPERQNHNRPKDHCKQQRHGEGEVALQEQEVHLDALQVLKDEDQDHDQNQHANHQGRPRPTEAGLGLARKRFLGLYIRFGGTLIHFENTNRVLRPRPA
jgi:hypothetical protein